MKISPYILAQKLFLSQSVLFFKINEKRQHMFYHLSVYIVTFPLVVACSHSARKLAVVMSCQAIASASPSLLGSHSCDHLHTVSPLMYICESEWLSGDEALGMCLWWSWREERTETIIYFLLLCWAIFFHYVIHK